MKDLDSENFRPAVRRWGGKYEDDVKITYYSNPRIFSCRTERDDTKKPGKLLTDEEREEICGVDSSSSEPTDEVE